MNTARHTNQVKLTMTAPYLEAAVVFLPFFRNLVHGDLSTLRDMATYGYIPLGSAAPRARSMADGAWTAESVETFTEILREMSLKLGYMPAGEHRCIAHSGMSTYLARGPSVRALEETVHCAYLGAESQEEYPWEIRRSIDFHDDGSATLTLAWDCATYLAEAAEIFVRLSLGKIEALAEAVRSGVIPLAAPRLKSGLSDADFEVVHGFEDQLRAFKPSIGHEPNGSFGIGNESVKLTTRLAWELFKEIKHQLTVFRNPDPEHKGVYSSGDTVRYTNSVLPVVEVVPIEVAMPSLEDAPILKGTISQRYLTFYIALGRVPEVLSDVEADKAYEDTINPFYEELIALVEERTNSLPERLFIGDFESTYERWEFCEQDGFVEHRNGEAHSSIAFVLNPAFTPEHFKQLVDVIDQATNEIADKRGVPVGKLLAEVDYSFEGTTRFKLM